MKSSDRDALGRLIVPDGSLHKESLFMFGGAKFPCRCGYNGRSQQALDKHIVKENAKEEQRRAAIKERTDR